MFQFLFQRKPTDTRKKKSGSYITEPTHENFLTLIQSALDLGYTRKQLAEKIGVSYPMIYKYMNGKCRPSKDRYLSMRKILKEIVDDVVIAQTTESSIEKTNLKEYSTSDLNTASWLFYNGAKVSEAMVVSQFPKRVVFTFKHDYLSDLVGKYIRKEPVQLAPWDLYQARSRLKAMAYNLA